MYPLVSEHVGTLNEKTMATRLVSILNWSTFRWFWGTSHFKQPSYLAMASKPRYPSAHPLVWLVDCCSSLQEFCIYGGFLKYGNPWIIHFNVIFHYKFGGTIIHGNPHMAPPKKRPKTCSRIVSGFQLFYSISAVFKIRMSFYTGW